MKKKVNSIECDYIIIATNNDNINININKYSLNLDKETFYFLGNNHRLIINTIKFLDDIYPSLELIELNQQDINDVIKIMTPLHYKQKELTKPNKQIFTIKVDNLSKELFDAIKRTSDRQLKSYMLACFLSKSQASQDLFNSLIMSGCVLFSDTVQRIIESNISKKWKLSLIAKELHLSEIAIRKKLSRENTNFNKILLDIRMNKAAILILKNERSISFISKFVGISSPSHFIKIFQLYYGVTPKKFLQKIVFKL